MPCGCKKNTGPSCYNCALATVTSHDWMICSQWSNKTELPLLMHGNYTKYSNGSVLTKRDALCAHYATEPVVQPG